MVGEVRLNKPVKTPNGVGYPQGQMWENGVKYIIVRHKKEDLISTSAGMQLTRIDLPTVLFAYEEKDIEL